MSKKLLLILDNIEREKGIAKEIIIEAVEAALVSAARKALHDKMSEVDVKLDRESGDIKVYSDGKEVDSGKFGRIAAQTAKQVIIQKIREAERDIIYAEYKEKEGNIVTGTVHRFEKGSIIVDLGKTEGILYKREQSSRDNYKQGQRVSGCVLEVNKTARGPQILLSRSHAGFVKKLFELEVPEIYEGIVEIKALSREPGERTKIAVFSKDDKVDCVGACVGMRGSRVKSIVQELGGEKMDIVRYSDDVKEYIASALSPAKISSVNINHENKRAEVIVDDDQLSLAIGKKGQNVRLAAKLTEWNIDITNKSEAIGKEGISISDLPGVGAKIKEALKDAKLDKINTLAKSSVEDLTKLPGIGKKTAEKLLKAAKEVSKLK